MCRYAEPEEVKYETDKLEVVGCAVEEGEEQEK